MMKKRDKYGFRYRDWDVYQDARVFRSEMINLVKTFPESERFELVSQTKRALNSILLNIAEGANRKTDKDTRLFIGYAKSSLDEVVACLDCALDDDYVTEEYHDKYLTKASSLGKRLTAFSNYLGKVCTRKEVKDCINDN